MIGSAEGAKAPPHLPAVRLGPPPQCPSRSLAARRLSLRAFALERSAVTYGLTAVAIEISITRFLAAMRRDGIAVEWGPNRPGQPPTAEVG